MLRLLTLALLTLLALPAHAEPVSFQLDSQTAGLVRITVFGDDGVAMASDTRTQSPIQSGRIVGDLSGVISPLLTVDQVQLDFNYVGLDYQVGTASIPVTLDISGFLGWTPEDANQVTLTSSLISDFPVSGSRLQGTLTTPFGVVIFDETVTNLTVDTNLQACDDQFIPPPCRFGLTLYFDTLDSVVIDHDRVGNRASDRVGMNTPATASIGMTGGVNWSIGIEFQFQDVTFGPTPVPSLSSASLAVLAVALAIAGSLTTRHRR
jgi:hypothetical protein